MSQPGRLKRIQRIQSKSQFVFFYVWGDSFEVYREARRIVEAGGIRAGWDVYDVGKGYLVYGFLASPRGGGSKPAFTID